MTSGVASKNLYELLGNDPDQDPELRTQPPPIEPIDKPLPRSGKRNGTGEAPLKEFTSTGDGERGGRGRGRGGRGRGRGRGGNEQAFQDREAGSFRNRDKPTDEEGFREERRGGRGGRGGGYEGRGGRRGRGNRDDRHSRTVYAGNDQQKQADKGWGEETGIGELRDEQAGEAIALEDAKDGVTNWDSAAPVNADGEQLATDENAAPFEEAEPEPEDKTKSYADYLAELAQKKLQLGGSLSAREANEGSGKNLPEGKQVSREESEYFAGSGGKARRERERKTKEQLVLDHDYAPRQEPTFRGGRGGGRGRGRGEGSFRGEGRGEGRGRGGFRGRGEGRGGGFRGGRGGPGGNLNVTSDSDFPGLG